MEPNGALWDLASFENEGLMTFFNILNSKIISGSVQIIWSKEDAKSTQIAIGTTVVAREYMDRASVTVDEQGSTLYIGIAKSEDAGKYKCSVAVRGDQPEQSHEVRIRGENCLPAKIISDPQNFKRHMP